MEPDVCPALGVRFLHGVRAGKDGGDTENAGTLGHPFRLYWIRFEVDSTALTAVAGRLQLIGEDAPPFFEFSRSQTSASLNASRKKSYLVIWQHVVWLAFERLSGRRAIHLVL